MDIRQNVGIAVDGGGVRGAIVAHGLFELENKLGLAPGQPIISDPRIKVLAGTSTGALIAGSLAIGLTASEILDLYRRMGEIVFSTPGPLRPFGRSIFGSKARLPRPIFKLLDMLPLGLNEIILYALLPARYDLEPLRKVIHSVLQEHLPENPDPTMKELGEILEARYEHTPTLVVTAAEPSARKTRFIKTTPNNAYNNIKLIDALLASSCIPTYFPPVNLPKPGGGESDRWLVDGGVGNFGNPAMIVAWELCDERNPDKSRVYNPNTVTVYSFGTGYVPRDDHRKAFGSPTNWWALQWTSRAIDMFMDDAIREQSRNIVAHYDGIDLRRFQVRLEKKVLADDFALIDTYLREKGELLQQLIRQNSHALNDPDQDPEDILHTTIAKFVME